MARKGGMHAIRNGDAVITLWQQANLSLPVNGIKLESAMIDVLWVGHGGCSLVFLASGLAPLRHQSPKA